MKPADSAVLRILAFREHARGLQCSSCRRRKRRADGLGCVREARCIREHLELGEYGKGKFAGEKG